MKSVLNSADCENVFAFPRGRASTARKTSRFRQLLISPETNFIMEAHNGLSAKLVEEAGFQGVWASGLSISASLGVRDSNEASWTQVLEVLEFMSDATDIPMMVDADTGYGNFNNFRRLVGKLQQRDVAAVCIEDKLFPKTNSFIGENQPLADIREFCGKIKAGKDALTDDDFSIVARTEALIAGWGLDEALRRAEAYHEAGADAILIHSKKATADEILAFASEWANRCPVVIVPTTYYATPTEAYREAGINLVIWANHNLRAAISAMRETCRQIFEHENLFWAEKNVAQLGDVFAISGDDELRAAEEVYLAKETETKAVVLGPQRSAAAADALTVDIQGKPLYQHLVDTFNGGGVNEIAVTAATDGDAPSLLGIRTVTVPADSGEVAGLARALESIKGDCVVAAGDVVFRSHVLTQLMECSADITVVVDVHTGRQAGRGSANRAARCTRPYTGDYFDDELAELTGLGAAVGACEADGTWIGLVRFSVEGLSLLRAEIARMEEDGSLAAAGMRDLIERLIESGAVPRVVYVTGGWLDVNDLLAGRGETEPRASRISVSETA